MDALVSNTELGSIIAQSTSGVASEALDVVRSQGVGMDNFIARLSNRVLRRDVTELPAGPPLLIEAQLALPAPTQEPAAAPDTGERPGRRRRERSMSTRPDPTTAVNQQGHYAGAVDPPGRFRGGPERRHRPPSPSATAVIRWALQLVTSGEIDWAPQPWVTALVFAGWLFIYYAYPWSVSGKTFGMAMLGIRVVRKDGSPATPRNGILRTLALPLSFLTLGIGFVPIITGRHRRALHDAIGGTAVVYSWDARAARLRFLARQQVGEEQASTA